MNQTCKSIGTVLLGIAVFAFWLGLYPQALNYQEQNQLFLFTWAYLGERLALPGGGADYVSEFLVQFFYWPWAGALILAVLAVLTQLATWKAAKCLGGGNASLYPISFIPSLLTLVYMGDMEVLVSYPVALLGALALCPVFCKAGWHRLWLIPIGWWLIGPLVALPVLLSALGNHRWADLLVAGYLLVVLFAGYRLLADQYPWKDAFFGINYYRLVESLPLLQVIIPAVAVLCILVCGRNLASRQAAALDAALSAVLVLGTAAGVKLSYDKDAYEVLAYDSLIRHERYGQVVRRAMKYQPRDQVSACSVNFCLFAGGELNKRLGEFYQCGTEGLVLPSIRDNVSDITSAELLWMMGMPNVTLQYYFDLQESIQNGRKSGRFTARIADCNIVNGWYDRAERYLDILSHSLCYRKWAEEKRALIRDESRVAADPEYAYVRSVRFRDDFIMDYGALDLMMALLYNQNRNNFMAAEYYVAWQKLKKLEETE